MTKPVRSVIQGAIVLSQRIPDFRSGGSYSTPLPSGEGEGTHIQATRRRLLAPDTVRLTNGDAENRPFRTASFDVVYSFGVLHHTPDTQGSIDEVHRVLNFEDVRVETHDFDLEQAGRIGGFVKSIFGQPRSWQSFGWYLVTRAQKKRHLSTESETPV